jgi:hypothetical protein
VATDIADDWCEVAADGACLTVCIITDEGFPTIVSSWLLITNIHGIIYDTATLLARPCTILRRSFSCISGEASAAFME